MSFIDDKGRFGALENIALVIRINRNNAISVAFGSPIDG